jgi:membrane protease YdiL (CAAX protease family)
MLIGKETGIGPALRVLRHFTDRERFYQLKFQSGERALLLAAGMPAPSVELVRLVLGGLVPWQRVWEYNPIRAGGYGDYVRKLKTMFSPGAAGSDDSFNYIRDTLLSCESIADARALLLQRERLANSSTSADEFMRSHPRPPATNEGWELGIRYLQDERSVVTAKPDLAVQRNRESAYTKTEPSYRERLGRTEIPAIPNRYRINQDGKTRILTCVEAPTIIVRAKRGLAISAKQARKFPAGTIFLDGAVEGDPFVDAQKEIYNLNHPEACIRSLATCEQAMVAIRKGLDLSERDWVVWVNNADVDTVLALWVLLNHQRCNQDAKARGKIMPLLRLAGTVDAHGHDMQDLAALPPDLLHGTAAMLKQLQQQEAVFKEYGRWSETDLPNYIADQLRAVDDLVYTPEDFSGLHEIDELSRAQIGNRSIALACRSKADIDQVQRQLQKVYGQRLGILIFEDGPSSYRVRCVDRNLLGTLKHAYERLNLLDPAVTGSSGNRWSGSDEGGASPRKTGTGLTPTQIIEAVREAFWKPSFVTILSAIPRALALSAAALAPALAVRFVADLLGARGLIAGESGLLPTLVLTITVGILFWSRARQLPGLNGWRVPAGLNWLRMLPAALVGAVAGGVWAQGSLAYRIGTDNLSQFTGAAALLPPLAAELLFRGIVLGDLAARLPIQRSVGSQWCCWPNLISTGLYAAASLLLFLSATRGEIQISQLLLIVGGAVVFGIASGTARERSESILASVLLHWICTTALILSSRLLF